MKTDDSAQLFPRLVGADGRIAAVNRMDAGQLRLVLKQAGLQRSVRSCAAARLQHIDRADLAKLKEVGR